MEAREERPGSAVGSRGGVGASRFSPAFRPAARLAAAPRRVRRAHETARRKLMAADPLPTTLPYWLLGLAALLSLALPTYCMFYNGLPELTQDFLPPVHGAGGGLPSRAVHAKPREGEHFTEGELHEEGRVLGNERNPIAVVEFTDFFCPHCQEAHATTVEPLLRDWVAHGQVRLESHPVAFLDDDSMFAACAALCAQEQHKYWEVRELLFQVGLQEEYNASLSRPHHDYGETIFGPAILKRLATLAQLDISPAGTSRRCTTSRASRRASASRRRRPSSSTTATSTTRLRGP